MKEAILYEIINKKTGAKYVGATTMKLNQRWYVHSYKLKNGIGNKKMGADFLKYGKSAFEIKELDKGSVEYIYEKEKALSLNKENYCYNEICGGIGSEPMKQASILHQKKLEDKSYKNNYYKKISESLLGRKLEEGVKRKISAGNKGKKRTEEFKAKRSFSFSGEGNPNSVYFLNTVNGVFYSSKDIESYFGKCIGHIRKMFRQRHPLLNNFIKC